ncbi:hypothetical protein SSCG_01809 [Streptomyces clavuligerus]|nr:hypothetical protein SSCG_01809 [Streptomyces clavuligerus]
MATAVAARRSRLPNWGVIGQPCGISALGLSRTCKEALLNTLSIARLAADGGDSDPIMDEALRRVRQGGKR